MIQITHKTKERKRCKYQRFRFINKSARRDSNPRPRPWQGRAPPTEPLAHITCPALLDFLCIPRTSITILYRFHFVNKIFEIYKIQ